MIKIIPATLVFVGSLLIFSQINIQVEIELILAWLGLCVTIIGGYIMGRMS